MGGALCPRVQVHTFHVPVREYLCFYQVTMNAASIHQSLRSRSTGLLSTRDLHIVSSIVQRMWLRRIRGCLTECFFLWLALLIVDRQSFRKIRNAATPITGEARGCPGECRHCLFLPSLTWSGVFCQAMYPHVSDKLFALIIEYSQNAEFICRWLCL